MVEQAKKILSEFAKQIPPTTLGPERVRYIIENIDRMTQEEKIQVLNLANYILTVMLERNASDVEIGGFGAQNFIWFRIY